MRPWSSEDRRKDTCSFEMEKSPKPSIVSELQKVLGSTKNHHIISQARFSAKLTLREIQKKPAYLADDQTCIHYLLKPDRKLAAPDPFNKLATQFYAGHPKPYIVFNCEDDVLGATTPQFPSAYHPAFHYKNYEQFRSKIRNVSFDILCEVYQVSSWSIDFVNVNSSCYYAPVLIVHEWRKLKEPAKLRKPVQNILFESRITKFLDDFRVADMKKQHLAKDQSSNSFNYYIRNHISNKIAPKSSKFVTLDMRGALLQTNLSIPASVIPLGNICDYERFKRPLPVKYLAQRKQLNLDKFVVPSEKESGDDENWLFEDEEYSIERQYQQIEHHFLEEAENYNMENDRENRLECGEIDSEEDLSDQQDHLKKVYERTLRKSGAV